jgi:hypothetical protein
MGREEFDKFTIESTLLSRSKEMKYGTCNGQGSLGVAQ